jgi:VanZ family protein
VSGRGGLFVLWAPVAAYMGLIFALSSIASTPSLAGGSDKGVHALLYAGLCALLVRAFAGGWRRRVTRGAAMLSIVVAALYGVSDEIHQSFVPPRQADVRDVVADAIGALSVAVILYARSRRAAAATPRGGAI